MQNTSNVKARNTAARLTAQLARFESLPNDTRVALPLVCELFGRSPASVWRDVKAGRIPKPVKAGIRCTRWLVGDLRGALQ